MARSNPTFQKRQRERRKQEQREEKVRKKQARDSQKEEREPLEDGVDPDIAGIKPGPQPLAIDEEPPNSVRSPE